MQSYVVHAHYNGMVGLIPFILTNPMYVIWVLIKRETIKRETIIIIIIFTNMCRYGVKIEARYSTLQGSEKI